MDEVPRQEIRTVTLDMNQLFVEAVELAGEERASELWIEYRLDSEDNWPGKWAKAMEVIQRLRAASEE